MSDLVWEIRHLYSISSEHVSLGGGGIQPSPVRDVVIIPEDHPAVEDAQEVEQIPQVTEEHNQPDNTDKVEHQTISSESGFKEDQQNVDEEVNHSSNVGDDVAETTEKLDEELKDNKPEVEEINDSKSFIAETIPEEVKIEEASSLELSTKENIIETSPPEVPEDPEQSEIEADVKEIEFNEINIQETHHEIQSIEEPKYDIGYTERHHPG